MKLRRLHIDNYKMFKDFDISFVDEDDEALPIIVLAGVNGSGKTTLLEYLISPPDHMSADIEFIDNNEIKNISSSYYNVGTKKILGYSNKFIYLSTSISLENIKDLIPNYLHKMVWDEDILASESFKRLRKYIENLFIELELDFEFASRDAKKNIFFKKKNSDNKFFIDELSTGEKTLMSKVLYLYLEDIKDKIILIDEPELSLHPSWQNRVLKIYENFAIKNNCQIIIATHSPHIIGSAKNEYLRFLKRNQDGNIEAIDNITAYGRDIEWVLEEMGVKDTRLPKIVKRFDKIQELINSGEFDKADNELDKLEYVIGENDKDILALRNDLAFERIDFEEDN